MKKLITLLNLVAIVTSLLLVGQYSSQGAVSVYTVSSNQVTNLALNNITVRRVTVSASAGAAPAFLFYDAQASNLQWSNTVAYSNYIVTQNYTNEVAYTDSLGIARTNVYWGQYSYWTNIAANTVSNEITIGSIAVQTGVPYTVDVNWTIVKGLYLKTTNNVGGINTVYLEYD